MRLVRRLACQRRRKKFSFLPSACLAETKAGEIITSPSCLGVAVKCICLWWCLGVPPPANKGEKGRRVQLW